MMDSLDKTPPRSFRCGVWGWLLIVATAASTAGCMQTLANGARGLDVARRERMIAEKIKDDPFPNAAEAGVTTGTP